MPLPTALVGQKQIVFANIEEIHEFHETIFLPILLRCKHVPTMIGEAFTYCIERNKFDAYITFVINKKKSEKLCFDNAHFFRQIQTDSLGIGSFLLKPVQRLPRYILLLDKMIQELMLDLDGNKTAIAACCLAEKKIQRLLNDVNKYCE